MSLCQIGELLLSLAVVISAINLWIVSRRVYKFHVFVLNRLQHINNKILHLDNDIVNLRRKLISIQERQ